MVRGELATARELAEQCLRLAQNLQTRELLQEAHHVMGVVLFSLGEFSQARTHLDYAVALYDPRKWRVRAVQDPRVGCLGFAALTLWALGFPDESLRRSRESLALAQELSHPFSLSYALVFAALLHQLRREVEAAQELAESVIALSHEQGFALFGAVGTTVRGWTLAKQGRREEGRKGLPSCVKVEPRLWLRERSTSNSIFSLFWPRPVGRPDNPKKGSRP
jgi:adenylate cyclase